LQRQEATMAIINTESYKITRDVSYRACDSSSLRILCMWNIKSPPFTNSMTKNKLKETFISVLIAITHIQFLFFIPRTT